MKTLCLEVGDKAIQKAAEVILKGGLVAFPTETVYGLGANALDGTAAEKIYKAKGRPSDNPLIIHVNSLNQLEEIVKHIPPVAYCLAEHFWPGPLTMVFHKKDIIPLQVTGGLDTVAVRMPGHKTARQLIQAAGVPIAAPSANSAGKPSPTRASHVLFDFDGRIDVILDGGPAMLGLESTIVDVTTTAPCLLRPGSVTLEMLQEVVGQIDIDPSLLHGGDGAAKPKAPGMKYTHYAPSAQVVIVDGPPVQAAKKIYDLAKKYEGSVGIMATDETKALYQGLDACVLSVGSREDVKTIGQGLFKALRNFDFYGVNMVYAESIPEYGVGLAVMNRLKKAAGYRIIHPDEKGEINI